MSHFTHVKTQIRDLDALLAALEDLGYHAVEVHDTPVHLYGYRGDVRPQTAEVVIRRKYVGRSSNDLGFKRQDDGTFQALISGYDAQKHNAAWLQKLTRRYAYHVVQATLGAQGFTLVQEQTSANGEMRLTMRRFDG